MRKPDLSVSVDFPRGKYTTKDLILELVMGDPAWAADEASVASFDRLSAAIKAEQPWEDKDFERVCGILRQKTLPPQVALELGHLRNVFVFTPKVPE